MILLYSALVRHLSVDFWDMFQSLFMGGERNYKHPLSAEKLAEIWSMVKEHEISFTYDY